MTPEFLAHVAEIYRDNVDAQPVEAIRRVYPAPYRTAARWVELFSSDKYGFLLSSTPGRGRKKV
jgi:hypothetical protein